MLTNVNTLQAYLYLHGADPMPAPVLDEHGNLDVEADDLAVTAWSEGASSYVAPDSDRLARFIHETDQLLLALEALTLDPEQPSAPQYMSLFYEAAKAVFDQDKSQLRTYFLWLYLVVFQRSEGSRWGEFVEVYGVGEFTQMVRDRFASLL